MRQNGKKWTGKLPMKPIDVVCWQFPNELGRTLIVRMSAASAPESTLRGCSGAVEFVSAVMSDCTL
jgi:hypothetical protein